MIVAPRLRAYLWAPNEACAHEFAALARAFERMTGAVMQEVRYPGGRLVRC